MDTTLMNTTDNRQPASTSTTTQGSKRKRTTKDSSPPAADRISRLSNDQFRHGHRLAAIDDHTQATTASPGFAWPVPPSTDTTETARSGPTVLALSYTASLPSREGHRETTTVGRHDGTAHSVEQSHALIPCGPLPTYPEAHPCGSSNPTTAPFHSEEGDQLLYFYGLDHNFDPNPVTTSSSNISNISNINNNHRSSHQGGLMPSGTVFAHHNRGQYQDISVPGNQLDPAGPTSTPFHPGIVDPSSIHHSSASHGGGGPSAFQSSLYESAIQGQPSAYSTAYHTYHFVPDFDTSTTSKRELPPQIRDSNPSNVPVSTDQNVVGTVANEQPFSLPHQCAMGGGEIYLAQHCNSDTYSHFSLQSELQDFSPAKPQPLTTSSLPNGPELPPSDRERERADTLTASQQSTQPVQAIPALPALPNGTTAASDSKLTERRSRSRMTATSENPRPSMASEKNPVKKRGPFNLQRRKETAETRKRKACLRCRVQKIRCDADQDEVDGSCLPCQGFSKISKKTLHHVSCYRGKLTDVVLFRRGGLNLTDRWRGTEMKDVGDRVNTDVRSIQITLGICEKPIEIKVVRFHAGVGDVVARFWTVREGDRGDEVRKKKDLEPFCLVDIWATAAYFEKYIIDNAISTMIKQQTPHRMLLKTFVGQDVIKRTYIAAVEHYLNLDDEIEGPSGKIVNPQKKLLGSLFVLWHAIRHTTGSAYICGQDTLGMKPEVKDETYPLFGKVSVPRMILAQFDSINHTKLLSKYGHKVLRELEAFIFRNQSTFWWPIYLSVFILLHEASVISADRYRHARNNFGGRFRYSIPSFVEELQEGCNNILVHWHYYNCHPWPNPEEPWERHRHFMSELTSEQHELVMETLTDRRIQKQLAVWKRYKEHNGMVEKPAMPTTSTTGTFETPYMGSQTNFDWDHPCYWVSQMFEERWQPHPTYQREYSG